MMASAGPLAKLARPSAAECRRVCDALASVHGLPRRGTTKHDTCELFAPHTVLDSLVRTILSQNTTDITSGRAFASLKAAFPDWEQVRTAAPGTLEAAIRVGGLADIKAQRIKAILDSLLAERGELSLEHLRTAAGADIKQQLSRYKGVGPKSIACVLLFCLGYDEFPVDTHVLEISKQLGWLPANASREAAYHHLNERVPDDIKYPLHVLLVEHGKVCGSCKKGGKKGKAAAPHSCPLAEIKRSKGRDSSGGSSDTAAEEAGPTRKKQKKAAAAEEEQEEEQEEQEEEQTAAAAAAAAVVKQEDVFVKEELPPGSQQAAVKQELPRGVKEEPAAGGTELRGRRRRQR